MRISITKYICQLIHKSVEIENKGLILRGVLHIPEDIKVKEPIVCIFHGFTGDKIGPHFIFVKLSRILARRGIASVRFDFAGSGESDGDFVDENKIGILGLSL